MRKKKIKKERKKLTRKQLIILIVVTIILGIICYFASTEITKNIIDKRTMEKRLANEDYSDLRELDTINNITLNDLINSFNEISDSDINIDDINDNKVMINDIEIEFNLNGDNINIISINFKKKSNDVKELISNMIMS